jgi:hypothetical protein
VAKVVNIQPMEVQVEAKKAGKMVAIIPAILHQAT